MSSVNFRGKPRGHGYQGFRGVQNKNPVWNPTSILDTIHNIDGSSYGSFRAPGTGTCIQTSGQRNSKH